MRRRSIPAPSRREEESVRWISNNSAGQSRLCEAFHSLDELVWAHRLHVNARLALLARRSSISGPTIGQPRPNYGRFDLRLPHRSFPPHYYGFAQIQQLVEFVAHNLVQPVPVSTQHFYATSCAGPSGFKGLGSSGAGKTCRKFRLGGLSLTQTVNASCCCCGCLVSEPMTTNGRYLMSLV